MLISKRDAHFQAYLANIPAIRLPPLAGGGRVDDRVGGPRFRRCRGLSSGRQSVWLPARPARLVGLDLIEFPQRKAYIVESFEQSPGGVIVNRERQQDRSRGDIPILKIHSDFQARMLLDELPKQLHIILCDFCRQQPRLARIPPQNVRETRPDTPPKPVVHQPPPRMLT